jgi:hypothetical protein
MLLDSRTGTSGKLKIEAKGSYSGAKCEKVVDQAFAGIGSGTKNQLYFNWENQDSIASISQGLKLGITGPGSKQFTAQAKKDLLNKSANLISCDLTLDVAANNLNGNLKIECKYIESSLNTTKTYTNVSIGNPDAASAAPNTGTGGVDATGDSRPSCETTSGNPLSWGLCPAINGAAAIADWVLESFIVPFLENVPISTDRGGDSTGVFDAWSGFRILANIMLVGVLLFIVIAEAVGKE